jgi:hypothetical protein
MDGREEGMAKEGREEKGKDEEVEACLGGLAMGQKTTQAFLPVDVRLG